MADQFNKCGANMSVYGRTDATAIGAGLVGEIISATLARASALPIVSGAATAILSILLTPGRWTLYGNVVFVGDGIASFTMQGASSGATPGANLQQGQRSSFAAYVQGAAGTADTCYLIKTRPLNLGANTTIYLEAPSVFVGGAPKAHGSIGAIRTATA